MTFILNILHKEISIVASDDKAFAGGYNIKAPESNAVYDFNKISLHAGENLALGMAGNSQDHYYHPTLFPYTSIDEVILKIRKHMEEYLRVHNRPSLSSLESFEVNDGIVSFYDKNMESYYTYTFLFSPVHNQNRLHRAKDIVQIFTSGSGSKTYEKLKKEAIIEPYVAPANEEITPESCIRWVQDVFAKVGANDITCGAKTKTFVSSRSDTKFHEHC